MLFAILQKYEFSSKSQHVWVYASLSSVVCDTAKVRVFKQITTDNRAYACSFGLFAILQKYEFSSKSQLTLLCSFYFIVVCDTAKVRVFKQITTTSIRLSPNLLLFAILQKYEFSSKSQPAFSSLISDKCCLRYCKSTSFQANHNIRTAAPRLPRVVCDTAKVRVFKQITTSIMRLLQEKLLFAILQKYEFSSKSQQPDKKQETTLVVCDTANVRVFKQITTSAVP